MNAASMDPEWIPNETLTEPEWTLNGSHLDPQILNGSRMEPEILNGS